ncbi:MAG: FAD/NAD(P)-binding protein [Acidimicrobiia bacterium]|jgi:NAD(P)H-flavin reductase
MTQAIPETREVEAMLPRPFRVVSKTLETPDTLTLVFADESDEPTTFRPGQFMMMYVFGVGEIPISIAGNPRDSHTLVHTIRAVGAVTDALCALGPGDVIGIRGPYGTSWPLDEAVGRDLVVIAGGIGLAPLRPAVIEALTRRDEYRSLSLIYGARTPSDLLYRDDLLGWGSTPAIDVEVTVDRASSDWWGDVGMVTKLLSRFTFDPGFTSAFVCGPEVMMRVVARELRDLGVAASNIAISMERNMKCGIGLCGHCQYGSDFLCWSGPIGTVEKYAARLGVDEI